ncbi:MAG: TIGR01777 family oxidoreductase [Chloroflexota bacterium]
MRIIITGGTGLIGRELTSSLIKDDHEVIILSRSPSKAREIPAPAQVIEWDGLTATGWGETVDGADAIVNLAGSGIADARWSSARKKLIVDSRVHAGRAVMEAIEGSSTKPKVLIQSSAVGYYGAIDGDKVITDDGTPGSDYLAGVCFDWESSTSEAEKLGVRRPIIRTGIVLSNKGGAWPKIKLPFLLFAGGPLGSGKQWYPWIHIEDEVRAIRYLIEDESASGPFNLTAPNPVTNKEMAQSIGQVMGRPSFFPAPGFAIQAALGEMSTILLDGQRAVPKRLQELGFSFMYSDIDDAVRQLTGK